MQTTVKSPQSIFNMPQRLLVPLFQRPYVWNQENQWEPLWRDIEQTANRVLANPDQVHAPHFLGAIVLQQVLTPAGDFQVRTIIDGQQRLTTLQLMLDAFHAELERVGADRCAARLLSIIRNDPAFCTNDEDQFKVWPTNRDRPVFEEVMAAELPVNYPGLTHKAERLQHCHKFFAEQANEWLNADGDSYVSTRADALEKASRELLQLVVIDLDFDENAQEIFETLNSRGAQLSAADLIKNFIFQRLLEEGADTEAAYEKYWKRFESAFWETEVSAGRVHYPRSSVFLNAFLISRLGDPVTANEVFSRFKSFALHDANIDMIELLKQIDRAAAVYESYLRGAQSTDSDVTPLQLFAYRTQTLETETITPVILTLLDPELPPLSDSVLAGALHHLESFLARRMLVRATAKRYNLLFARLVLELRKGGRETADSFIELFFRDQTSDATYWPDDEEVSRHLANFAAYRRLRRPRLRMVLEAVEDYRRGYVNADSQTLIGQRCPRGGLSIEHVLPQSWENTWPLNGDESDNDRNASVHVLGNLTLLTSKLNSSVSNGPWLGDGEKSGKREGLRKHSSLQITAEIVEAGDEWTVQDITARTKGMTNEILEIWPVPNGHSVNVVARVANDVTAYISVADLVAGGALESGVRLIPAKANAPDGWAIVLPDGRLELNDGTTFDSPTGAGLHHSMRTHRNGWSYWKVESSGITLRNVRRQYIDQFDLEDSAEGDVQE